jgi:GMP synthase (glutamine-hydrolysing)
VIAGSHAMVTKNLDWNLAVEAWLPPGAVLLAENTHEPHHAFRIGNAAWGVQFHQEYTPAIMSGYIRNMSPVIQALGKDPARVQQQVNETPEAGQMLARFAGLCSQGQSDRGMTQ